MATFKLKIVLVLWSIICLESGCTQDNYRERAYQNLNKFVLNEDYSGVGYILFFETNNENQVAYQDAFGLQRDLYYSPKYKDVDKGVYLRKMMMGEVSLSCKDLTGCFILSKKITEDYRKNDFEDFLKNNTTYIEKTSRYIITHTLSHDEKLSVTYYLYKNNYYSVFDDYSGDFFSTKDLLYEEIDTDITDWVEIEE